MNIQDISVSSYFKMTEQQKINFYNLILNENPKIKNTTSFITAINCAKQAKIPEQFFHQKQGNLQYIAPLKRSDKIVNSLYFLTICDCGSWCILEGTNFRKEKQIQCPKCSLKYLTTMKDISGEIYGQMQAIYPTSKRGKDGSVYWMCKCIDCGNEQEIIKSNLKKGHLCSQCKKKSLGEFKVQQLLQELELSYELEKIFDDCVFKETNCHARFDFYVNNSYIIEVDGQHHFFPVNYSGKLSEEENNKMHEIVIKHDRYKNQYCLNHNIPIIRIPYFSVKDLKKEDLIPETSKFLLY